MSLIIFFRLSLTSSAYGATLNAATCSRSDIQAKVDVAKDGDIILIPAGNCDWGSGFLTWRDKNIYVKGAGTDPVTGTNITVSVRGVYVFIDSDKARFRISDIAFSGTAVTQSLIFIVMEAECQWSAVWVPGLEHVMMVRPMLLLQRTGNSLCMLRNLAEASQRGIVRSE